MQCPVCGTEMVRGRFGSHSEKWHLQAYGPFGLPLAFTAAEDPGAGARACFAGTRDGQDGLLCPRCRAVLLLESAEPEEDWECPACGEIVPGKFATCVKCQHRRPPREAT